MAVNRQVLVIDDDVDLNYSLSEFLRDEGYIVDSVTDPTQVEKFLNENAYNIILLDLKMPNISGVDLIKVIKEKLPQSRLIIMSGRPFVKELLIKLGLFDYVDDILDKPFGVETLLEKLKTAA